ncbi:hypothetical protein I4U23_010724 [Adineta vaga]|nr:hypothetical protein I4U23_010724 [Adineta vaga]
MLSIGPHSDVDKYDSSFHFHCDKSTQMIFIIIITFYSIYRLYQYIFHSRNIDPQNKFVLISGCDTGVGHLLAIELDKKGFHVLAGVFLQDNVNLLKEKLSPRAIIFHLDITKQEDIDYVYDLIRERTNTLHAIVNNAGIMTHGCIDWTSMDMMRQIMNVNFFGHVMMTKKFLPLLITKRYSRVVNVVSAAGFFAFPNTSAYSASKYAMKSFSDCLRREMSSWNLYVSTIEPGALKTPMMENYEQTWRNVWNELSIDVQQRWGINYLEKNITKALRSPFMTNADNPLTVVRAIEHAIVNIKPSIHYRPGWQGKLIFFALYLLPTWISDKIIENVWNFIPDGVRYQCLD